MAAWNSHPFKSYRDDKYFINLDRKSYFEGIPREFLQSATVFLDPDNGIEVKSVNGKSLHRHVKFEELKTIYDRISSNSCLPIFQHPPRIDRKFFLYGLYRDLMDCLDSPVLMSITDNQVALLIIAEKRDRQGELRNLLPDYVRANLQILDWSGSFRL
jgi:hypothetical protein